MKEGTDLEPTSIRLDVTRWVFVGKKIGIRFRKAVLGELLRGWVHVGRNKPLNPCVADARRRTDDLKVEGSGSFGLVVREDRRSSNRPNKVDSGAGRVKGVVFWSKALNGRVRDGAVSLAQDIKGKCARASRP